MKKHILIVSVLLSSLMFGADELGWVDTQIEAIKPPRKGMTNSELANAKSPFIFLKKNRIKSDKKASSKAPTQTKKAVTTSIDKSDKVVSKQSSKNLVLSAVINKSALINGKWYKLDDSVYGYKLSNISRTTVVLTKGKKKLVLTTSDTKQNIKFK